MATLADFFCGCGGIGLAFKQSGFNIVGAWDLDKWACKSYAANLGSHVKVMDIQQMKAADVPQADVWSFGFPCQDISHAGLQKGLHAGDRSRMFFEVMRLLAETRSTNPTARPTFLLAENVKGLKKYLEVLREEYKKVGYRMEAKLINSLEWGVPQARERYYVIGVRDDYQGTFVFPESHNPNRPTFLEILEPAVAESHYKPATKAAEIAQSHSPDRWQAIQAAAQPFHGRAVVTGVFGVKNGFIPQPYSNTLDASAYKGIGCNQTRPAVLEIVPTLRIRKLTPREYARIQGFPDDYKLVCSDTQMYKQFGNSVSVPVVKVLADQIKVLLTKAT